MNDTIKSLLLSLFATAIVTTITLPNRPTSKAISTIFSALSNGIRAMLGSTKPGTTGAAMGNALDPFLKGLTKKG